MFLSQTHPFLKHSYLKHIPASHSYLEQYSGSIQYSGKYIHRTTTRTPKRKMQLNTCTKRGSSKRTDLEILLSGGAKKNQRLIVKSSNNQARHKYEHRERQINHSYPHTRDATLLREFPPLSCLGVCRELQRRQLLRPCPHTCRAKRNVLRTVKLCAVGCARRLLACRFPNFARTCRRTISRLV